MRRVHIIGGKNHGKTTLVVQLVQEFTGRGYRVGTIKHTHHHHELDTPGKDSHRHRLAGSAVVGIRCQSMNAVFWPGSQSESPNDPRDEYASFAPLFSQCDLVLVEGDTSTPAAKIEVWRAEQGTPVLARNDVGIAAVVTDDPVDQLRQSTDLLRRSDLSAIADYVLHLTAVKS